MQGCPPRLLNMSHKNPVQGACRDVDKAFYDWWGRDMPTEQRVALNTVPLIDVAALAWRAAVKSMRAEIEAQVKAEAQAKAGRRWWQFWRSTDDDAPKPLKRVISIDVSNKPGKGEREYEGRNCMVAFVPCTAEQQIEWRNWWTAWVQHRDEAAHFKFFMAMEGLFPEGFKLPQYTVKMEPTQIVIEET